MKKGTKIAIGIGFALVIGVIVYFIVKTMKGGQNLEQPTRRFQEPLKLSAKEIKKPIKTGIDMKIFSLN